MKTIVGILAALYALAQVGYLVLRMASGQVDLSSPYGMGQLGGSIIGICLGSAIALACFQKKKSRRR